jgi:hypothetical protein
VARAASLTAAGRRRGTERGDSIKRGCKARFRVVKPHNSDLAQIRVPEDGWNAMLEHTMKLDMFAMVQSAQLQVSVPCCPDISEHKTVIRSVCTAINDL